MKPQLTLEPYWKSNGKLNWNAIVKYKILRIESLTTVFATVIISFVYQTKEVDKFKDSAILVPHNHGYNCAI